MSADTEQGLLALTAQIVSAYLSNHAVPADDVAGLIALVRAALSGSEVPVEPEAEARPEPAVPIKRSVFPDYIICLEDGKKLKTLKRHLATAYGLTPAAYRERWGLPPNYPMVAPDYASARSRLARQNGLGRRVREADDVTE